MPTRRCATSRPRPCTCTKTPDVRDTGERLAFDGTITPPGWGACIAALLKHLPAVEATDLLNTLAPIYKKLLTASTLETDATVARRMRFHRLYVDRKNTLNGDAKLVTPMIEDLREALTRKTFGPIATRFGDELVATADLERGIWRGKPVDLATMDALQKAGNEMTLNRFARRLPDASLRQEARRRVIRVHIAMSAF